MIWARLRDFRDLAIQSGISNFVPLGKVPLLDANGEVIGILGTYNDITARVEAMNALKRHSTELEFKNNE